ncbi:MAG: CAAX amino terminal protease self- immunity [Candidatus Omnitrophica bacterium ADurb.Bin314]|jgi:hypothetical protein|nr:MAG: CAAX amino terminal protease self- immunity [Candidatus Omnitrophica bacterium ADurb.Bin314]HOE68081.1 type II CAAX endopeptidase family protein [Candidatus Omnitrophota bacterium]
MIKDILKFFKRERLYLLLVLLLGAFYAFMTLGPKPQTEHPRAQSSLSGLEQFRAAERKFSDETLSEPAFGNFARKEPLLAAGFGAYTALLGLALTVGFVINFLAVFRPSFREKILPRLPPPSETRVWPFSILFKTVVLFVVWSILISFLMGVVSAIFPVEGADNAYMVLHTFILNVLCVMFMVRFLKQQGSSWRDLGFNVPQGKPFREMMIGWTGYLGVLPIFALVLAVLLFLANLVRYEPPPHPLVNVFIEEEKRLPFLVAFSAFLGAVIGPVFEEVFFRGFCYPILKGKVGKVWAMVISAAFFASIHHTGFVFWPIFVLGLALAYLYESRRSLLAPITLHVTHNTLFISYFFLVKQMISSSA